MRPRPASLLLVSVIAAAGASARAAAEGDASDYRNYSDYREDDPETVRPFRDEPAAVDAPRMRNVEPRTRVYLDGTLARSEDLSALPNIAGRARGVRLALGGSLKLARFQFDVELPALQMTRLDLLDWNPAIMIDSRDRSQTSYALGDSRLGAQWTAQLASNALVTDIGFGVGARLPTHTGRFTFHLVDGTSDFYVLPYYFHVQPALLFGVSWKRVTFMMNQGALVLLGPDGVVAGIPVVTPTIYFWDAHYGIAVRVRSYLAFTLAASTTVQLNQLDAVMFPHLNRVRSVFVMPGCTVRVGAYRIDLVTRFGIVPGAEPIGVITYSGTQSLTLRATRELD